MPETLDYSVPQPPPRPWLKALFIAAGLLTLLPLLLGILLLFYALGIGLEGSREAFEAGVILIGFAIASATGLRWLYRKVMPGPDADRP